MPSKSGGTFPFQSHRNGCWLPDMKQQALEENLTLVQNTLELWLSFRRFMLKGYSEAEVTAADETDFLEVKSSLSKNLRALSERIRAVGNIDYGEKSIRELLTKCVSVSHLRQVPKADQKSIRKDWHSVFVRLSRCVGALKFLSEGYIPQSPSGKGKKKKGPSTVMIVVGVLVLVGIAVGAALFLGLIG